jgi:hypothetical protein
MLPVPGAIRFQPVAADEVAARLVELALGEPAGLVPDLAGPEVYPMADLLTRARPYGSGQGVALVDPGALPASGGAGSWSRRPSVEALPSQIPPGGAACGPAQDCRLSSRAAP